MATLKRSIASLIGGIAIGVFVLVLWLLLAGGTSPTAVVSGLIVAGLIGAWVRLADL
jgi:mannose/fructose/N-acetylgalactosamine-specific phosphotransferase system component IID